MSTLKLKIAVALVLGALAVPAAAGEVCEKKCYKAQTCPVAGTKCLDFNWCRDECQQSTDAPLKDDELKDIPKLPGAPAEKLKI